jgi:mannose-6-phosphate isomerase-like protein (cupin superfamily)
MNPNAAPVLVRAANAEVLADGPTSDIVLYADADETAGALTANRAILREGSPGAPAHFHTRATETFFVIDGVLDVLAADVIHTLRKGDLMTVPAGVPHAFAPAAQTSADVLVLFTPGLQRFDYYRLLQRVAKGQADVSELSATSNQYDNQYFDSPIWTARR